MYKPHAVGIRECLTDFGNDVNGLVNGHCPFPGQLFIKAVREIFHDYAGVFALNSEIIYSRDVWMGQTSDKLSLSHESVYVLTVG